MLVESRFGVLKIVACCWHLTEALKLFRVGGA
jgi:hypothetical protein